MIKRMIKMGRISKDSLKKICRCLISCIIWPILSMRRQRDAFLVEIICLLIINSQLRKTMKMEKGEKRQQLSILFSCPLCSINKLSSGITCTISIKEKLILKKKKQSIRTREKRSMTRSLSMSSIGSIWLSSRVISSILLEMKRKDKLRKTSWNSLKSVSHLGMKRTICDNSQIISWLVNID